jgi:drug/metabolite transporter superfamily protein YnfA
MATDAAFHNCRPPHAADAGGTGIAVALPWMGLVDGIHFNRWDMAGTGRALADLAIIAM